MNTTAIGPTAGTAAAAAAASHSPSTSGAQRKPLNILLTGGARGIGRGLFRHLLQRGHRVFMLDCNEAELEHVKTTIAASHAYSSLFVAACDLRQPAQITAAVAQANKFFQGHLDVLINNAAMTSSSAGGAAAHPAKLPLEDWNSALATNLTAPMLLTQACYDMLRRRSSKSKSPHPQSSPQSSPSPSPPHQQQGSQQEGKQEQSKHYGGGEREREHGGTIINIASTRAHQSEANWEAYAASKAGLIGLTHALAVSLAEADITVNAISPGWINVQNECKQADEAGTSWDDGLSRDDHSWHLTGRVGRVEDIYKAVRYLISARFVTGTELVVDGGVSRKMVYPEEPED